MSGLLTTDGAAPGLAVVLIWSILAFICGSLPFSVWVGRWFLRKDIRRYGDANPGATNALRAGGVKTGAPALLLDMIKGAVPVALAYHWAGLDGWPLILVGIMPVLGHAFSPFLGFRGGKAVAVTGGVWAGLTAWEGPTVGGLLLGLAVLVLPANGWAVMVAMVGMLLYLLVTPDWWNGLVARPDQGVILGIWLGQMAVLIWKHRSDLSTPPRLRARLRGRAKP